MLPKHVHRTAEDQSMVKRYVWDEEGYPPDGMELVAASDYDAAAARIRDLEQFKEWAEPQIVTHGDDLIRIRELEAAIVDFWNYAKLVLPMPVHPAVGAIMRIGQELESQSDRGSEHG